MNRQQLTVREIFLAARAIRPQADRVDYVRRTCGDNDAMLRKVEALLHADESAGAFLMLPPADGDFDGNDSDSLATRGCGTQMAAKPAGLTEFAGEMIGRYKLLQQIGVGGFGVVYMAEQREPVRRRVALKIIKLGMDTRQVIARFEAERQALALMDHPNIARVLDGGSTDTGRPYFVMEYIKGVPILDYCDTEKLGTEQRLDLFAKVCHAIQHAHQKGIIHRDIKPSNVLITMHDGVPVPKVIDFGIAKATNAELTTRTLFTEHRQLIGTPAYMSPEQAEMSGLDIDTRSDIYSLGVLLYELLTGTTPFGTQELTSKGFVEMMRIIREVEPHKPSTRLSSLGETGTRTAEQRRALDAKKLSQTLKGDLDWIVMKCLEKDRQRRYETANSLAMDVRRYLGGEPVLAAPPSAIYRLSKFIRRHRGMVSAGAAVAAALLIGVIAFAWQATIARDQRDLARKAQKTAEVAQAQAASHQRHAEAERDRAERELTRAEWLVYAGKLTLAQNDFEDGNGGLALHYLNECEPQKRGWEWRYLSTRVNAMHTLTGHMGEIWCVAFSPDGMRVATGSGDKTAKVWDAATGQELLTLAGHKGLVLGVAFSPDGRRIVTGGGAWGSGKNPGEIKVWDARTGQFVRDIPGHAYCVWSVAFSPDGTRLVSGAGDWAYGPGEVKVWDFETGQELFAPAGHAGSVRNVAHSTNGQRFVSGSDDGAARVWDSRTGQELLTLRGWHGGARGVAISPDGQRIVVAEGDMSMTPSLWDADSGQWLMSLKGHTSWVNCVAYSQDGERIVTGSEDQTTRIWDADTGQQLLVLKGHASCVRGVAFSPDGTRIVTVSRDQTAKVWDAIDGQEVPVLKGHVDFVSGIAFSPDCARLVTASGDGTAKIWDTASWQEIRTVGTKCGKWEVAGIWGVAFSPDGRRIVTGSNDKSAKVWNAATGDLLLELKHANVVSSVAFSPDGSRIATGVGEWNKANTRPGVLKLWDAATGQELLSLNHEYGVASVAFSPDGLYLVSGGGDRVAIMWNAQSGEKIFVLEGHTATVCNVAFSPDGRQIVTGSDDGTARVWDAKSGKETRLLTGHTAAVHGVAFSPDGSRIATGGNDRTAKIWDAGTGHELLSLRMHSTEVWSLAFSPDGQRLVTGTAGINGIAKVWYAAPPPQVTTPSLDSR